ncbi:MAG: ATP phosphoribosyltransferase regulatory subunit [Candidatus Cloacimonetes bacterium]|nr:ATP phosphoribosyltransferase regulatory subunit [Candidatus Cloacimonadota bacterium]
MNIFPDEIWKWKFVERELEVVAGLFNFREIRTSILQERATIEEPYRKAARFDDDISFDDLFLHLCGPEELSLRPESTITILKSEVVRRARNAVQKFWYNGPVFRRTSQSEHYQIHQFGFEILGNESLIADVEVMKVAMRICKRLSLRSPRIDLTSYGCHECRPDYISALQVYLQDNPQENCRNCRVATLYNPLQFYQRCERETCQQLLENAPRITDYLCDDCRRHLDSLTRLLSNLAIDFRLDPYLARPFGYYYRTVFNIVVEDGEGETASLGGGGRYDYLSKAILDDDIPAVGFTFDMLKLIRLLDREELFHEPERPFTVFICSLSPGLDLTLLQIEQELHDYQFHTILVSSCREVESARDEAHRLNCSLALLLDERNIRRGKIRMINLVKEYEEMVDLSDILDNVFRLQRAIELV